MSDQKRQKLPSFVTPIGTLKWPKLSAPDYGNDAYPNPNGAYKTKLVLTADHPATKAFIASLTPLYEEAMAEAQDAFSKLKAETRKKLKAVSPNPLFTELLDKETEEPTGEIEFSFSMAASGVYKKGPKEGQKWFRKPLAFDAKGLRIEKVPEIWSGSKARISLEASKYFIPGTAAAGLSLKLVGFQIIDLVTGGQRSAAELGFGAEEGYEYEAPDPLADESAAATAHNNEGDF